MAATSKALVDQNDDMVDEFDVGPDAERIAPKIDLRRKAKERRGRPGDIDPIAAAEAAMSEMSDKFSGWMQQETETLVDAWQACSDADFDEASCKEMFSRAHDMKGQAATLGFPAAGHVAGSLCRLLDLVHPTSRIPRELVRQHIFAVRAIARESKQDEPSPIADQLAQRLMSVTNEFIESLG